ncbi:GntR family transcriptional regulator [Leucothrix arctica]|uniref:GntR family transcriptional regulator n=1 Tax=Leucothrix arctica TaxID=1481894 RepID=A0A317C8P5_9GAMM|nr:GntR family transcriptional regulator [Leucothrix arctica]PWQ94709.1 GntR family transcriptional regulator [Leucothrix arctica]
MPNETTASTENTSLTNQTYQRIYTMIIQGDLKPGVKLKIEELRKNLGTGASPVREALSLLTSDHLVDRIDQRGFRVSHISADGFTELLKTRCWLEERALRESMGAKDVHWEERLVLAHHRLKREHRMLEDKKTPNPVWESKHKEFHMTLLSVCGSSILIKICDQLYDQNIRYRNAAKTMAYPTRDVTAEHDTILEHVLNHNVDKAVEELISHYTKTGEFLSMHLKQLVFS